MNYRVVLKEVDSSGRHDEFAVNADNVQLTFAEVENCDPAGLFFQFTEGDDDEAYTVAAIPYDQVLYIKR